MQTKSMDGHAVMLGWLLAWSAAPGVVAAQTSDVEGGEAAQPAAPVTAAQPAAPAAQPAAPAAQPAAPAPAAQPAAPAPQQDTTAFVPSEPLGATALREHVDSEPPDGFDLSRFPDRVSRAGFTMELGIGVALTHLSFDLPPVAISLGSQTEFGLAPPSLSLGGFLNRDLAIMFRIAGTSWFRDWAPGESIMVQSTFFGGAIQYWPSTSLFLGAGIGLGLLDNYLFSEDIESSTGLMLTGRVGYSFYHYGGHSLALVGEFFPAFYDSVTSIGFAANLEWQLL